MVMLKEHLCNPINYQVFAFYSNDPSSNPAEVYNFSVEIIVEKNKNKVYQKGKPEGVKVVEFEQEVEFQTIQQQLWPLDLDRRLRFLLD